MPRAALAEWQHFGGRRFRWYHLLAVCQGIIGIMTGFDVLIPFALEIGAPPAITPLLGMLPLAGGMAVLAMPRMLARTDGNLRGLTMLISAMTETRGFMLVLIVLLVISGVLPTQLSVFLLLVVVGVNGVLAAMVGSNLLTWHAAVLGEQDRRLVVPRLMAVAMAIGALLLLPMALVLDALVDAFGLIVYVVPFGLAGVFGVVELMVQWNLPRPGRVQVPASALAGRTERPLDLTQFMRASVLNALGMGVAPYVAVYSIAVLGLTPGFTMAMAAVGILTMVVASVVAGSWLTRGSSARLLRFSFAIRAGAMAAPILALPGMAFAPLLMMLSSVLGAIGFSSGVLAANERLFRLINGPAVLRQYGRFTATNAGAMTAAQLASGTALALGGSFGYPVYAGLYAISSGLRLVAMRVISPRPVPADQPTPRALPAAALPAPIPAHGTVPAVPVGASRPLPETG